MRILTGTSGFSYKEWKGSFYPEDLKDKEMLGYYAGRLGTVEINNTFYRMPRASVLESWCEQVGEDFRFVIKTSRKITHIKRFKEVDDDADYLFSTLMTLGDRLGPVLVQLPGNFRKDVDRLRGFLDLVPNNFRAAFEFRHDSWLDDEVADCLRARECSFCFADVDEEPPPELQATAPWLYLRLRRDSYDESALTDWKTKLEDSGVEEAFVFFKHEDAASGPLMAERFAEM